jgi:hypothetical protein
MLALALCLFTSQFASAWWNSSYNVKNRFDYYGVGITGTWSNFSVPFNTTPYFTGVQWTNGTEVYALNSELEFINGSNAIWWVGVPRLAAQNDTVYQYSTPTSTSVNGTNSSGVWTDKPYLAVYHFGNQTPWTNMSWDSSPNTAVLNYVTGLKSNVNGKFGYGITAAASGNRIESSNAVFPTVTKDFTVGMWIYRTAFTHAIVIGDTRSNAACSGTISGFSLDAAGGMTVYSGRSPNLNVPINLSLNQWHFIVYGRNNTQNYLYVDGAPNASVVNTSASVAWNTFSLSLCDGSQGFDEVIVDEVFVIANSITADWVKAKYNVRTYNYNPTSQGLIATSPSINQTIAGRPSVFNVTWTGVGLGSYVFSFNNGSGFINDSAVAFTQPNSETISIQKSIPTSSTSVSWIVYASQGDGTTNATPTYTSAIKNINFPNVYDEITLATTTTNITAANATTTITLAHDVNTYSNFTNGSLTGIVTYSFLNNSYYPRKIVITNSGVDQNIYLLSNTYPYSATLTLNIVTATGAQIPDALVTISEPIAGVNRVVTQDYSTSTGTASFVLDCQKTPAITIEKTGYPSWSGTTSLACSLGSSIVIILNPQSNLDLTPDPFQNVTYAIAPQINIYNQTTRISARFSSRTSDLQYYNLSLMFENGTNFYNNSGTSPSGGELFVYLDKTGKGNGIYVQAAFKSYTMQTEFIDPTFLNIYLSTNSTAPMGIDRDLVTGGYSSFIYTIIPLVIIAVGVTQLGVASVPATALVIILGMFSLIFFGWLSIEIFLFITLVVIALVYLGSVGEIR